MSRTTQFLIFFAVLMAFLVLVEYSQRHTKPTAYDHSQIERLNVISVGKISVSRENAEKILALYGARQ